MRPAEYSYNNWRSSLQFYLTLSESLTIAEWNLTQGIYRECHFYPQEPLCSPLKSNQFQKEPLNHHLIYWSLLNVQKIYSGYFSKNYLKVSNCQTFWKKRSSLFLEGYRLPYWLTSHWEENEIRNIWFQHADEGDGEIKT